jgi:hypothetical protein
VALTPPYDGYLKADLEAEADRRGIDTSDDPLKSDLISRLEEHDRDQERASAEPPPEPPPEQQVTQLSEPPPEPFAEEPEIASAPILRESDERPEPLPTEVEALGAVQQRIEGHQPTPYPNDDDLRNRLVNAFTPDLIPNPPPIEDLTMVGQVNVGEINVEQSSRSR